MQTLTIKVDDSYLDQILAFLQKIPKNKREIVQHDKPKKTFQQNKDDDLLNILANGPTISPQEADKWENEIKQGYMDWKIEEF